MKKIYQNRFEWHLDMNAVINEVLCSAYPRNWKDEDFLTRSILTKLRDEYEDVEIIRDKITGKKVIFSWDVYKNTKQHGIEVKHGDVGILVQILFPNNKTIEGVAYIEAKRIYEPNNRFDALDFSQLRRIVSNSSFHRTVFYDHYSCKEEDGTALAVGLPTNHLIALNDNSRALYPYCEYYSYILTNRYLQGYELDFNPDIVNGLKGLIDVNGGVDYLIVAQTTSEKLVKLNLKEVEINNDMYSRIITEKPDNTPTNNYGGPSM